MFRYVFGLCAGLYIVMAAAESPDATAATARAAFSPATAPLTGAAAGDEIDTDWFAVSWSDLFPEGPKPVAFFPETTKAPTAPATVPVRIVNFGNDAPTLMAVKKPDAPKGYTLAVAPKPADTPVVSTKSAEPAVGTAMVVTASAVNMRSGPGTSYQVLDTLIGGTNVQAVGEVDNGWVELIVTDSGTRGFMSGRYLRPAS